MIIGLFTIPMLTDARVTRIEITRVESPTFEVVSRNELDEECYASPAISRGQIFVRTLNNLYCIGQTAK